MVAVWAAWVEWAIWVSKTCVNLFNYKVKKRPGLVFRGVFLFINYDCGVVYDGAATGALV